MNKQNSTLNSKLKKAPKYKYIKAKLTHSLSKLDRRKKQLELLQLEISFLEKKVEAYKDKLG